MTPIDMSKAALPSINTIFPIVQETSPIKTNLKRKRLQKKNEYLHKEIMRKMIWRILTEKHMPEEKLAHALGITIKSLKQFCSKNCPSTLVPKINLPLIKLYCVTKFNV